MYYRLLSVLNSVIASISELEIATCGTWVKCNKLVCRVKGVSNYGNWGRLIDSVGNTFNLNIKESIEELKESKK